jgi:hypothetical protein
MENKKGAEQKIEASELWNFPIFKNSHSSAKIKRSNFYCAYLITSFLDKYLYSLQGHCDRTS